MVKALNRIYLVLELSESVHAQIEHGDDWENKALMRESILTLMGQRLDDEKRERQRTDSREFSIWNYSIMYQCIGHFKDICSWILMNPTLTEEYPPIFGHLFKYHLRRQAHGLAGDGTLPGRERTADLRIRHHILRSTVPGTHLSAHLSSIIRCPDCDVRGWMYMPTIKYPQMLVYSGRRKSLHGTHD